LELREVIDFVDRLTALCFAASPDSSVGIATGYGLDGGVSIPGGDNIIIKAYCLEVDDDNDFSIQSTSTK
jgi:hypothetical protein